MTTKPDQFKIKQSARERNEAQAKITHLKADARLLGQKFMRLGEMLAHDPEYISFDGQSITVIDDRYGVVDFCSQDFDLLRIKQLTDDLREALKKGAKSERQL
jgi:hypothetical protein